MARCFSPVSRHVLVRPRRVRASALVRGGMAAGGHRHLRHVRRRTHPRLHVRPLPLGPHTLPRAQLQEGHLLPLLRLLRHRLRYHLQRRQCTGHPARVHQPSQLSRRYVSRPYSESPLMLPS